MAELYGDHYRSYAVRDYEYVKEEDGRQAQGTLQCYCKEVAAETDPDAVMEILRDTNGTDVCEDLAAKQGKVYLLTSALSYLLIGLNVVLRMVCIMIVDWIGYPTETKRLSQTTTVTFIVQFFNSGVLLLLINANLAE